MKDTHDWVLLLEVVNYDSKKALSYATLFVYLMQCVWQIMLYL